MSLITQRRRSEALLLASQEGFSTKKGRNRGAGLAILIDNVAKRNRGKVGLYAALSPQQRTIQARWSISYCEPIRSKHFPKRRSCSGDCSS